MRTTREFQYGSIISYTNQADHGVLLGIWMRSCGQANLDGDQGLRRVQRDTEGLQERPRKTNCDTYVRC